MRGGMATTIELEVEPLTAKAFTPYGQLIAARDDAADFARPLLDVWHLDYRADAPVRLQIMRYHEKSMTLSRLERHTRVSEGRIRSTAPVPCWRSPARPAPRRTTCPIRPLYARLASTGPAACSLRRVSGIRLIAFPSPRPTPISSL